MEISPIRTDVLRPPQDDLIAAIQRSKLALRERDVLVIASKAIAIHEGRCVDAADADPTTLAERESSACILAQNGWQLCAAHGAFLPNGGVDESNGDGHSVLLPRHPHASARALRDFCRDHYDITQCGVIVSDSNVLPFRSGVVGVALGWSGFFPAQSRVGAPDLFGRAARHSSVNVADALAAAAVFGMGELSEQTPLCVVRDAPNVTFTDADTSDGLKIAPEDDIYWPLIKTFYEHS